MGMINLTGLATGLDTNELITKLMTVERQPRTRLATKQTNIQANKTALQAVSDALKKLHAASQALADPTLFANKQSVEVGNAGAATATITSGAPAGGYALEVVQLARASQASYAFTKPTADGSISISGNGWSDTVEFKDGDKLSDIATRINSDSKLHVVASVTTVNGVERLSLSSRATGLDSGFTASSPGVLSDEVTKAGQDSLIRIDGQEHSAATNVFANVIPGVTLQLRGVTSSATTINVGAAGTDPKAVQDAVKAFVEAYNGALDLIRTATAVSEKAKGQLGGDVTLTQLHEQLRSSLIASGPGGLSLPLEALGITTGKASGTATYSADAVQGRLTFDPEALAAALTSDSAKVRDVLGRSGVLGGLATMVNTYSGAAGSLAQRISASDQQISDLGRQMESLDARLANKEMALKAQFGRLEATISQFNDQRSWLDGQLAALQPK
jgi:flagellar hook-associated protein 2